MVTGQRVSRQGARGSQGRAGESWARTRILGGLARAPGGAAGQVEPRQSLERRANPSDFSTRTGVIEEGTG